ncbi:MAG: hypothetical protein ABR964_07035 [Tepidisphaeraceae bacterium]|jgi:hypothetical protein
MGFIEEMKWWHWVVISLLLGAALGYINSQGGDVPAAYRSMDPLIFESNLSRPLVGPQRQPWISDVVVYPPKSVQVQGGTAWKQLVNFRCLLVPEHHPEKASREPFAMLAPVPYEPVPRYEPQPDTRYPGMSIYLGQVGDTLPSVTAGQYGKDTTEGRHAIISANASLRGAHKWEEVRFEPGQAYFIPWNPAAKHTIGDFLKAAAGQGWTADFKYAWWQAPGNVYPVWMGSSFVLIGLIWPALIQMMLRGGFGRPKSDYDLKRFKHEAVKAPVPKRAGMTAADVQRLREWEQSMEAQLKASAVPGQQPQAAAAESTPVKKLAGGPVEPLAPAPPEEDKEYTGEFYPVEHPKPKTGKPPDS